MQLPPCRPLGRTDHPRQPSLHCEINPLPPPCSFSSGSGSSPSRAPSCRLLPANHPSACRAPSAAASFSLHADGNHDFSSFFLVRQLWLRPPPLAANLSSLKLVSSLLSRDNHPPLLVVEELHTRPDSTLHGKPGSYPTRQHCPPLSFELRWSSIHFMATETAQASSFLGS